MAVALLVLGCEPTPPEASTSPVESATQPAEPKPSEPVPAPAEPSPAPQPTAEAPAPLCIRMCTLRAQARAVGPEAIARDCEKHCEAPPSDCPAFGKEARTRVEVGPMHERAPKVWAEISKPEFYCGYSDPFTRGLAAAATKDRVARALALTDALDLDPFPKDACPSGNPLPKGGTATDAIAACAIDEAPASWHQDVDATSFLAIRAARLRIDALGLDTGDRKILLNTLVLATALAAEK